MSKCINSESKGLEVCYISLVGFFFLLQLKKEKLPHSNVTDSLTRQFTLQSILSTLTGKIYILRM